MFDYIDLSAYKKAIEDNISWFIDPALCEIPTDPVVITYTDNKIRVNSLDTMLQIKKPLDEIRAIIEENGNDVSGIALILKDFDTLSFSTVNEQGEQHALDENIKLSLKEFFTELKNCNREQIINHCLAMDMLSQLYQNIKQTGLTFDQFLLVLPNVLPSLESEPQFATVYPYIEENARVLTQNNNHYILLNSPINFIGIIEYFFIVQQSNVEKQRKSLIKDKEGNLFTADEIPCPYTREVINLTDALATAKSGLANNFLSLSIFLIKLAQIENDDVEDYLSENPTYLEKAEKVFINYVNSPDQFNFSKAHCDFLNQFGLQAAREQVLEQQRLKSPKSDPVKPVQGQTASPQKSPASKPDLNKYNFLNRKSSPEIPVADKTIDKTSTSKLNANQNQLANRYDHLWNDNLSIRENVLAVLKDYSKLNSSTPNLALFITGHWNRHHHSLVAVTVWDIRSKNEDNSGLLDRLTQLEQSAQRSKDFNSTGSLARRIDYIRNKISAKAELPEVASLSLS